MSTALSALIAYWLTRLTTSSGIPGILLGYSGNLNEQIHYAPHESERSVFTQGIYGTFFELGFKVQLLDYYMNN